MHNFARIQAYVEICLSVDHEIETTFRKLVWRLSLSSVEIGPNCLVYLYIVSKIE